MALATSVDYTDHAVCHIKIVFQILFNNLKYFFENIKINGIVLTTIVRTELALEDV